MIYKGLQKLVALILKTLKTFAKNVSYLVFSLGGSACRECINLYYNGIKHIVRDGHAGIPNLSVTAVLKVMQTGTIEQLKVIQNGITAELKVGKMVSLCK